MNVLDLEMQENDAEASTVGEYLKELLHHLWQEGESFNGKRPFGNSGWEYELYVPLIKTGLVDGALDEYGDIEEVDEDKAYDVIADAIEKVFLK